MDPVDPLVCRNDLNPKAFVAFSGVFGLMGLLLALSFYGSGWLLAAIAVVCLTSIIIYILYHAYLYSRLIGSSFGLVVVNPFSTRRIAWKDVESLQTGAFLTVNLRLGGGVTVWAVQANNMDLAKGRKTFPDEVAEKLERYAREVISGAQARW